MKHVVSTGLAVLALTAAASARAEPGWVPAGDALARLKPALGKQVDVRFSTSFAKDRLPAREIEGVVVTELPQGKICLFGQGKGLEPTVAAFASFAGPEGGGDICVPLADVEIRELAAATADTSAAPFYATDKKACQWHWAQGRDMGLWTERCRFDTGLWEVTYDAAQDLFALSVDRGQPYRVLQQFRAANAVALLPELKAKGLVLDDAECVMAQVADQPVPEGWTAYQVVPTGKRKEAFDSVVQIEVPDPPCGELGYRVDSIGFFMAREGAPGRVFYANLGQDGTMIDLASLTLKN